MTLKKPLCTLKTGKFVLILINFPVKIPPFKDTPPQKKNLPLKFCTPIEISKFTIDMCKQ